MAPTPMAHPEEQEAQYSFTQQQSKEKQISAEPQEAQETTSHKGLVETVELAESALTITPLLGQLPPHLDTQDQFHKMEA